MEVPFPVETHRKTRNLSGPHLEYVNVVAFFRCRFNIPLENPFFSRPSVSDSSFKCGSSVTGEHQVLLRGRNFLARNSNVSALIPWD